MAMCFGRPPIDLVDMRLDPIYLDTSYIRDSLQPRGRIVVCLAMSAKKAPTLRGFS